ncbi:MAG: diphthine--ammonia ligase [Oscillospiraceae bacterium]|nr:diphthine--ammonia ligase [Oscillospiraceae bacterium]
MRKIAISYSGGKESALALYRAISQGFEPVTLITTYSADRDRSLFHGLSEPVLKRIARSLDIPIFLAKPTIDNYAQCFENALLHAKGLGATACVFGDIDIEDHRAWGRERCQAVEIDPLYPLWGESRESLVHEFIDAGFVANIVVVDTKRLSDDFLGRQLTKEIVGQIAETGADICGENGEYHTFVSAGPIFRPPVQFAFGEKVMHDEYALLPVKE